MIVYFSERKSNLTQYAGRLCLCQLELREKNVINSHGHPGLSRVDREYTLELPNWQSSSNLRIPIKAKLSQFNCAAARHAVLEREAQIMLASIATDSRINAIQIKISN